MNELFHALCVPGSNGNMEWMWQYYNFNQAEAYLIFNEMSLSKFGKS